MRYWATPKRLSDKSATAGYNYVVHSENNGQVNNGGSCNGDSGGPIFLAGTSTIVAVTSWGIDPNRAGPGFGYRTDIAESLAHPEGFPFRWVWLDAGSIAFMGGILAKVFLRDLRRFPPFPVKDPRLSEALGLYVIPVPAGRHEPDDGGEASRL